MREDGRFSRLGLVDGTAEHGASPAALLQRAVSVATREPTLRAPAGGVIAPRADDFAPLLNGIDEREIGALADALREMMASAQSHSLQLRSTVEQAGALDESIAAASKQLHERLSLSARMLKAFQSQIERIDALLQNAKAGEERVVALQHTMQQRITDFETRLEKYLDRFDARLDEMVNRAAKRFQDQVAQGEESLKSAMAGLPDLDRRLAGVVERVSDVEKRTNGAISSLRQTLESVVTAREDLRLDIEAANEAGERADERSVTAASRLLESTQSANETGAALDSRIALAQQVTGSVSRLEETQSSLTNLLARVEPLLPLVQDGQRFAADQVRRAAEGIRRGVREEVTTLAATFRRLAEQSESAVRLHAEPLRGELNSSARD